MEIEEINLKKWLAVLIGQSLSVLPKENLLHPINSLEESFSSGTGLDYIALAHSLNMAKLDRLKKESVTNYQLSILYNEIISCSRYVEEQLANHLK